MARVVAGTLSDIDANAVFRVRLVAGIADAVVSTLGILTLFGRQVTFVRVLFALIDVLTVRSRANEAVGTLAFERTLQVDTIGIGIAVVNSSSAFIIVNAIAVAVLDKSVFTGAFVRSNSVEAICILAADRIVFAFIDVITDAVVVDKSIVTTAAEGAFSVCTSSVDVTIVHSTDALVNVLARFATVAEEAGIALASEPAVGILARCIFGTVVGADFTLINIHAFLVDHLVAGFAAAFE